MPENLRDYVLRTRTVLPDLREFIAAQERGIEKLTIFFLEEAERQKAWAEVAALGVDVVSSLAPEYGDQRRRGGQGRRAAGPGRAAGLPAGALMACGDGGNGHRHDPSRRPGRGDGQRLPRGEGPPPQFVTASNNEDGVALAVEKFVLGKEAL